MKATKPAHDWHCHNHDTYGWRGDECKQCSVAPSEVESLRAENAAMKEQVARLEDLNRKLCDKTNTLTIQSARLEETITTLQAKSAALVDALNVMENGAEECMDFDEFTAMLVPMDNWHGVFEVLAAFKGEK